MADQLVNIISSPSCPWPALYEFLLSAQFEDISKDAGVQKAALNLIALQFCEETLQQTKLSAAPTETEVNAVQADILQYIAGAILHKLRLRYQRMGHQENLDMLGSLIDEKKHSAKRNLINVKSRGGLLTPIDEIWQLLILAFKKFKSEKLKAAWVFHQEVLTCGLAPESPLCDMADSIVKDILCLFHKIMSHHECFLYLEQLKIKKKCTGKGKGLRTKLADKKTL